MLICKELASSQVTKSDWQIR